VYTGTISQEGATQSVAVIENTGQCIPNCSGLVCGDDGCGGSCGSCSTNQFCSQGFCVGSGAVGITLEWDEVHDLDIMVQEPSGELIYWGNINSATGGYLDVDSHADCANTAGPGVENIFWSAAAGAPEGTYTVMVDNWSDCGYVLPPAQTCNETTYQCVDVP
jgi:uncharacterized protein YfaP (DUF2135 family)